MGKYPNGFCHWPVAPHVSQDGTWNPSRANFTSLATPDEIGSGNTALTTLMHEGTCFYRSQIPPPCFKPVFDYTRLVIKWRYYIHHT